jgi:hypothetical protein
MKLPPLLLSFLLASAFAALADETAVKPQIDSVGLFKNGLCVVKCSFNADRAGDFVWDEPPRLVHGTFLVESDGAVTIRSTMRKVDDASVALPTGNLQADLAGAEVQLTLKNDEATIGGTMKGKVWTMPEAKPKPRVWSSADPVASGYARNAYTGNVTPEPVATTGGFLVLEGDKGARDYIALGRIGRVEILKPGAASKRAEDKASIIFTVAKAGAVKVSYLTRGASWVPAYFVDLTDAKTLRIRQTAVVKNELMPLAGAELALISGYPNVEFGHVDSPLWQGGSLAAFFQQIGGKPGSRSGGVMSQQHILGNSYSAADLAPLPAGDEPGATSQDLHFESIGKRSLEPGDALSLEVAAGETAYERVVEWPIADKRDAYGNYLHGSRSEPAEPEGAWDSVIFQNPLKFPMTTASATIRQDGEFRGQSQSNWTNPGQRSCLHITKALSLQTNHTEIEESGKRENEVWIGGRRYYRTTVRAEATARNFRSGPVTLLMKAQFSGALVDAEEKPADTLRREGVFSVNPRHELEWKLTLAPGAEKKVTYRYTVLVSS